MIQNESSMALDLIIALGFSIFIAIVLLISWLYFCKVYDEYLYDESETDDAD